MASPFGGFTAISRLGTPVVWSLAVKLGSGVLAPSNLLEANYQGVNSFQPIEQRLVRLGAILVIDQLSGV